jgi:hypothetical protein
MFRLFIASFVLLFATVAPAADNGVYIGAGITQTNVEIDEIDLDEDDNGFKALVGFRPLDWLAVEANYVDFGQVSIGDPAIAEFEFEAKGIDAFVVGLLDFTVVDLFAKVGVVSWDADLTLRDTGGVIDEASEDGTDLAYGVGVQARFGSLGARLEAERFDIEDTDAFDVYSLSVFWTFL